MSTKEQALKELTEIEFKQKEIENRQKQLRKIIEDSDKPKSIFDRVNSFENACKEMALDPYEILPSIESDYFNKDLVSVRAYMKLIIICRALNEGWVPNWNDSNEYKYYPWFTMGSGFGFSYYGCGARRTADVVGSRLCFKSRELAEYAGKQFLAIYKEYLTIQK